MALADFIYFKPIKILNASFACSDPFSESGGYSADATEEVESVEHVRYVHIISNSFA